MQDQLDSDTTVVVATFPSRMDAEVAREYLADQSVEAFVSADDAGGMHPQLQQLHGVKLVALGTVASRARSLLSDAQLLPAAEPETNADKNAKSAFASFESVMLIAFLLVMLIISFLVSMA